MIMFSKKSLPRWFDENGLFTAALFLLIFIPLYPKLPLLEAIPGYLVRVRLEDLLIFATSIIWFIQVLRGKVRWVSSFSMLIVAYGIIGLTSLLFAILISQTIPLQVLHVGKSALHYFRYIEYFSLFVFMYSGITTKDQARKVIAGLVFVATVILIYGVGQKYFKWPVFSTMNREYSKGQLLQLSDQARLHSTFGGHYDLAAYVVLVMPILLALMLFTSSRKLQILLVVLQLGGIWLLLETGSSISFAGYAIGIGLVLFLFIKQKLGLIKTTLLSGGLLLIAAVGMVGALSIIKPTAITKITNILNPQSNTVPTDVFTPGQENWSANARKYGLSIGIRFDTLWPQAIKGWISNPWLGKGYATLNKKALQEFTEADSTDNNYLRTLGETGLLGFTIFFATVILFIKSLSLKKEASLNISLPLAVGFIGSTVGLLVNAVLIDVFAASKVAFSYWALAGFVLKSQQLAHPETFLVMEKQRLQHAKRFFSTHWVFLVGVSLMLLLIHKQPFSNQSLVQNAELSPNSLESLVFANCLATTHQLTSCQTEAGISTSYQLGYGLYIYPWISLFKHPSIFYFANVVLALLGIWLVYKGLRRLHFPQWMQLFALVVVVTQSILYQLPAMPSAANFIMPLVGLALLFIPKKLALTERRLPRNQYMWWLLPVGYVLVVAISSPALSTILHNYRDDYRPWRYQAVWRANTFFEPTTERSTKPVLITTINPDYFKLYGKDLYTLLPLSLPEENVRALVAAEPEVYITNADIQRSPADQQAFETIKQHLGIHLFEIDCNHLCNFYRLYTEDTLLDSQPLSINSQKLSIEPNQAFKFLILSQRFDQHLKYNRPVLTLDASQKLKALTDVETPNLLFLLGDSQHKQEDVFEEQFRDTFANQVTFPISYVAGNWDQSSAKTLPTSPQFFVANNTAFIIYHPDADGGVGPKTKLFIFDALLQLEKHPEIKHTFIITHRSSWLRGLPQYSSLKPDFVTSTLTDKDLFFREELLPVMEKQSAMKWHVISGDVRHLNEPMVVYHQEENANVTYVSTSFDHNTTSAYLEVESDSQGNVQTTVKSITGQVIPVEQYTLDYWIHYQEQER
jgi:hypothetical protein